MSSAALLILQMVRIEFDSLFPAFAALVSFELAHLVIHALHAISVYDHYSQYMILSPAFACCIYFLSLDKEGPEAGEHDSNSPAPYLEQDYTYVQLLGSQGSTCSKRTLSCSHKQRMLALRHQAHSKGYADRQSAFLVYMVFALTQNID